MMSPDHYGPPQYLAVVCLLRTCGLCRWPAVSAITGGTAVDGRHRLPRLLHGGSLGSGQSWGREWSQKASPKPPSPPPPYVTYIIYMSCVLVLR